MAEFKEVLKQKDRLCKNISCDECGFYCGNNKRDISCGDFIIMYPEEAEKIIMDWAKENPPQTNADKFKEVFGIGEHETTNLEIDECWGFKCPPNTPCGGV